MARYGLSDEPWAVWPQVLPPEASTGRPPHDRRRIIEGILFVLKTGCPRRDVPVEFGNWSTVYERFRLWSHAGLWEQILAALQARQHASGEILLRAGQIEAYDGRPRLPTPRVFHTDGQGCPSYEMPHFSPREV